MLFQTSILLLPFHPSLLRKQNFIRASFTCLSLKLPNLLRMNINFLRKCCYFQYLHHWSWTRTWTCYLLHNIVYLQFLVGIVSLCSPQIITLKLVCQLRYCYKISALVFVMSMADFSKFSAFGMFLPQRFHHLKYIECTPEVMGILAIIRTEPCLRELYITIVYRRGGGILSFLPCIDYDITHSAIHVTWYKGILPP